MKNILHISGCFLFALILSGGPLAAQGSLQATLNSIFTTVLEETTTGPGEHGAHFRPSSIESSNATINAFSNFVTANVASFPLSSTVAGLTFDFSSGQPVSTATSLGPIFSERAQTLGQGRFNIGFNFSYLDLAKLRGIATEDIRFTFTHQNVGPDNTVFGDNPNEYDYMDMNMNLDLNATVLAFAFTVGITNRIDLSVAVPFISVSMSGQPVATINSFSFTSNDTANHFFGGDSLNPELAFAQDINDDAAGIGDIAIRAKVNFLKSDALNMALLAEYRLATGDEENFLGTGDASFKGLLISSTSLGDFSPHLNLGYEGKTSDLDRDEIEFYAGFDQKVSESLTLAVDVIGELEIGDEVKELEFPQTKEYVFPIERELSLTNIPDYSNDNLFNAAFGLKFSPKENLMVIGNVFVPLNDGGLRSSWVPTLGFEFSF